MNNNRIDNDFIPAVNFHLWEPCNMRCGFCFATFKDVKNSILPKGHLPEVQTLEVVRQLAEFGFSKITFAGGEPTLCPWLSELIHVAKEGGMTTMIVTNGSRITSEWLQSLNGKLDWIALSIDSFNDAVNVTSGRAITGKRPIRPQEMMKLTELIRTAGIRLKVNTVVHSMNLSEDMSGTVSAINPERWKLFQALPVKGQNDERFEQFRIAETDFQHFVNRHKERCPEVRIVPEVNDAMRGSYAMVDPAGRFYDSVNGGYHYSRPILSVGLAEALKEVRTDLRKFLDREGLYNWENNHTSEADRK